MDLDLNGKVALVTGRGSGIGAAYVDELLPMVAAVALADVNQSPGSPGSDDALRLAVDVTEPARAEHMVGQVMDEFGRLNIAVNCAGVGMPVKTPTAKTELDEWRRLFSVNLDGAVLCVRSELAGMRSGGSVVNVTSVMGLVATVGSRPYASSKHGLIGLTKATGWTTRRMESA